uniref:Uncharacterized protein LOC114914201 n=1 Tax=Elaeis guineensis var. tenera TaxID=51953 RepID=A0A8N4F3K5_ELAGV|nr:uncharacterized protein LOC114914201 [Elaeis guineensis]XP_029120529.1 uncharacterized protein LOC114914201 [Elaeis guineensis]XP_029120530.1 uncharacterized protein LOC114914201 [Elaeis guineensis]
MGDVQLPLRLSTSYYIAVSTSSVGEVISPTSNAPLFTFTKPTFKFFRLPNFTKVRRRHGTKDGNAEKVAVSPNWPFFRVVKSRRSETCSPSLSQDSLSSSSVNNNEGDGMESVASQKSPSEKSSPVSSISPLSVLSRMLFIEKEANMMEKSNENGGKKVRRDSLESLMSWNDAPKLSSVEGEKEMKWDISESSARYDHQLPRSTPSNVKDIIHEDDDELFELEITKSESSSIYGDQSTSLRRSIGSDILKAEADNAVENSSEQIQGDDFRLCDDHDGNNKKTITCRRDNPYFVLRLLERFSVSSPLVLFIFMGKMSGAIGLSQGSMLWMDLKKRILLLAASQMRWAGKMNLRVKQVVKQRVSGGEVELWKKNILMGRRCRVLELEDSGERQVAAKDATDVHMNLDGDEAMAEGFSLHELMEAAAEAPVFNWTSKEARSF